MLKALQRQGCNGEERNTDADPISKCTKSKCHAYIPIYIVCWHAYFLTYVVFWNAYIPIYVVCWYGCMRHWWLDYVHCRRCADMPGCILPLRMISASVCVSPLKCVCVCARVYVRARCLTPVKVLRRLRCGLARESVQVLVRPMHAALLERTRLCNRCRRRQRLHGSLVWHFRPAEY